ncbi:MAG: FecR family protein [Steroidobacteraceae bacterium]|jgi:ferric-dicitrate binding protein FerR (iron transport regulator)|nr:FecR family protein [Steroidobacteraceae bacterium]
MSGSGEDPRLPADAAPRDDADVARVLRLAAAAPRPSPERRAVAFERVHAEWRAALAAATPPDAARAVDDERPTAAVPRAGWSAPWRGALAASVAAAALGVGLWATGLAGRPGAVAVATRIAGPQATLQGSAPLDRLLGRGHGLAAGTVVRAGDSLVTGPGTAALLRAGPGLALRLAPDSRLRFDASDEVTLLRGQLYVEADGRAVTPAPLTVATVHGRVRHVGTRYLVRVRPATLDVAVREGRVQVSGVAASAPVEAGAGERLRLDGATGAIDREPVAAAGADWGWLGRIPTPVSIDGETLGRFLEWYAAESGRRVEFGAAATRADAEGIRLRGSVAGLTPDEALDSVAATADLSVERGPDRVTIDAADR